MTLLSERSAGVSSGTEGAAARGHHLAGLGTAALAFISIAKFYCRNRAAVNCTESSSGEGEQEGTATPFSAAASPSCPAGAGSDPGAQRVP